MSAAIVGYIASGAVRPTTRGGGIGHARGANPAVSRVTSEVAGGPTRAYGRRIGRRGAGHAVRSTMCGIVTGHALRVVANVSALTIEVATEL